MRGIFSGTKPGSDQYNPRLDGACSADRRVIHILVLTG